jgi:hypothetical protein
LILEPLLNFLSRLFGSLHTVRMPYEIRTVNMFRIRLAVLSIYEFRDRNYLEAYAFNPLWKISAASECPPQQQS